MHKKLKYWQEKLGLNDWNIVLHDNCPVNDFVLEKVEAETDWQTTNKCAIIRMISESEYGERIVPCNKERALIHELLHIKFSLLWDVQDETQNAILHQLIEDLAKALYEVKSECKQ